MIAEVARSVLAELEVPLSALRTDLPLVGTYQRSILKRQIDIEKNYPEGFVSDRAFDNLAYAAEHTLGFATMLEEATTQQYLRWVAGGTVFFIRPKRELLVEDGTRETPNWDAVVRIDAMIKFMLEAYRIPYLPIDTVSMQERVRIVEYVLRR